MRRKPRRLKACLTCGTPTTYSRCPAHRHLALAHHTAEYRTNRIGVLAQTRVCAQCGVGNKPENPLEVDHIEPAIQGGTNHPSNLRVLCRHCNRGRGEG